MSPPEHPADWSRATRPCGDSIILVAAAPRRCASLLQFVCGLDDSPRGLSSRRGRSWGRAAPCRCAPMPSSGRRTAVVVLVLGVAAPAARRESGGSAAHPHEQRCLVREECGSRLGSMCSRYVRRSSPPPILPLPGGLLLSAVALPRRCRRHHHHRNASTGASVGSSAPSEGCSCGVPGVGRGAPVAARPLQLSKRGESLHGRAGKT